MRVRLRIAGIFYESSFHITGNKNTVKNLLDMAVSEPGKNIDFSYTTRIFKNKESVFSFSAKYASDFRSPVENRPYPAGIYSISEDLEAYPVYSVWQYYIMDKKNVYKNRGKGSIPFTNAPISDGDSVIWRLVNIHAPANQKNGYTSPRMEQLYAV